MSSQTLAGSWHSYWETIVRSEPEWIKENVQITRRWLKSFRINSDRNSAGYDWIGRGRLCEEHIFSITFRVTRSGAHSIGTGMFLRHMEGAYLVGHWYGFSNDNALVTGRWVLVRPGRDPKPVIERVYGENALEAFCRSSDTSFSTPIQRKVFISYRHKDTIAISNAIQSRLAEILGEKNVFADFPRIQPGSNFYKEIDREISKCDTMLVLIGPNWINSRDTADRRQLDNPNDMVRMEIRAAIEREVTIVPVLIDDTPMPRESELPDEIGPLCSRHAETFRNAEFRHSIQKIVNLVTRPRDKL